MNAHQAAIKNDAVIADFLKRLERALSDAEVSVMWGKANPELSKTIRGLNNEIQTVRNAAISQFSAATI